MSDAITVAQKELKALTTRNDIQEAFRKVLGDNAPAFMASMLTAVNTNDRLKFCDPMSVINSAMLAASLDLPIEQNLGHAWMVPYKDKGVDKAQFQIGYKGLIQLALRSGQYKHINVDSVYNGEIVKHNRMTGTIEITGEAISEEAIGYYAYIETLNGYSHTVYMTREEMASHAKRYSKSWGHDRSPWTTNFDDMAKKTVIRRILTKYGILSVQMSRAMTADETPISQVNLSDIVPDKIVDATATNSERKPQSREANMEQLTGQQQPRPWSPEYIREKVEGWVLDLDKSTDNQKKVLAAVLDKVLGDKTKRYEVCQYLTGFASTADMKGAEAGALLHWLDVSRFEDMPTDAIRAEINTCHVAALKAKGQMEMAGVQ
jgi:recombination protein RecT